MGTDAPGVSGDGEAPARRVCVSSFHIGATEVSVAQWAAFARASGHATDAERFGWSFVFEGHATELANVASSQSVAAAPWWIRVDGADWRHPRGPDSDALAPGDPGGEPGGMREHPVVHVSWHDAHAFCAAAFPGGRLPTEAEWERAAGRGAPLGGGGGGGGGDTREFPWGDKLVPAGGGHCANVWQGRFPHADQGADGYNGSAPVTAFGVQNEYGLYNMVGNVWEWVSDAWTTQHTAGAIIRDPQGPALPAAALAAERWREAERVKKGGSFLCHRSYCFRYRIPARTSSTADSSTSNLGFRCVRPLGTEEAAAEVEAGDVCANGNSE